MGDTLNQRQQVELAALQKKHRLISPTSIVEFARDKKTALHARFTWDDTAAAEQYRLWQARQVLRVAVFVPEGSTTPIRAFVSLRDDRGIEDGGYRSVVDVLSDKELRAKMLAEALDELQGFEQRYRLLSELAPVFAAAAKLRQRKAKAKPGKNGRKGARRREPSTVKV